VVELQLTTAPNAVALRILNLEFLPPVYAVYKNRKLGFLLEIPRKTGIFTAGAHGNTMHANLASARGNGFKFVGQL
jgi:hypothetical protein